MTPAKETNVTPIELFHVNLARIRAGEGPRHVRVAKKLQAVRGPFHVAISGRSRYLVSECYSTLAEACEVGRTLIEAERLAIRAATGRLNNAIFACTAPA